MNANRLPDYLDHMRIAIADAQAFTEGMAQVDFEHDKRTQQAVAMSLIVFEVVWDTVQTALPVLKNQLDALQPG